MKYQSLLILLIFYFTNNIYSQDSTSISQKSIKTAVGIGFNTGEEAGGIGVLTSIGYQKSYGKQNRIRVSPNLIAGTFTSLFGGDSYSIASLELNLHYDLLKYKSFSLIGSSGVFATYSDGTIRREGIITDDDLLFNDRESFSEFSGGIQLSLGFRIAPEKWKTAIEIKPLNFQFGLNSYILGYLSFGIDFKLN